MEDKYYCIITSGQRMTVRELLKWTPYYTLEVDENVELNQHIVAFISKMDKEDNDKPKSMPYVKVKPIIKETFDEHHSYALKYINDAVIDGEYYLSQRGKGSLQISYFSKDEKQKSNIEITFSDQIEYLLVKLIQSKGHKYRPRARREGVAITEEKFKQFLHLTMQYLYDPNSLLVYLSDYVRNFKQLHQGNNKVEGFIISGEKTIQSIIQQLEERKFFLEKRLMENDEDSASDRLKLRGELEGISYSIKVVMSSQG